MKKVLLVDDEKNFREGVALGLEDEGWKVLQAESAPKAIEIFNKDKPDVIITDLKMEGMDGIALIKEIVKLDKEVPIIVLTAHGSPDESIVAMREGAKNFITKPVNLTQLSRMIESYFEVKNLNIKTKILEDEIENLKGNNYYFGKSSRSEDLMKTVIKASPSNLPIYLSGESGVGKQVVAELIHINSKRKGKPFVDVQCSSFSPTLLEDELFGHRKGAFTGASNNKSGIFERADGGTLFLDEIGEISKEIQVKLLKVIEEKTFSPLGSDEVIKSDFRLVVATNRNLREEVKKGNFREDLFYRLAVFEIKVPPLRERKEDIMGLALAFLKQFCDENDKKIKGFSSPCALVLKNYNYPGNIRELKNIVESSALMTNGSQIEVSDLPSEVIENYDLNYKSKKAEETESNKLSKDEMIIKIEDMDLMHSKIAQQTLKNCNGDRNRAAQILGISTKTLNKYLN